VSHSLDITSFFFFFFFGPNDNPSLGECSLSECTEVNVRDDLEKLMMRCMEEGIEGLVLKDRNGTYEPGKRKWLKLKKDYLNDGVMADTADLVVFGAWYGSGDRGGMMSSFLLGTYDKGTKKWLTVCKCATGFDDDALVALQSTISMKKINKDASKVPSCYDIAKQQVPDLIMEDPRVSPVWEVTGAHFSKSPIHTACGISIRFPRITRVRDDKDWQSATNLDELKHLVAASKLSEPALLKAIGMTRIKPAKAKKKAASKGKSPSAAAAKKKAKKESDNSNSDDNDNDDDDAASGKESKKAPLPPTKKQISLKDMLKKPSVSSMASSSSSSSRPTTKQSREIDEGTLIPAVNDNEPLPSHKQLASTCRTSPSRDSPLPFTGGNALSSSSPSSSLRSIAVNNDSKRAASSVDDNDDDDENGIQLGKKRKGPSSAVSVKAAPAKKKAAVNATVTATKSRDGKNRASCRFGASCYRQNPQHKIDEAHPGDHDYIDDDNDIDIDDGRRSPRAAGRPAMRAAARSPVICDAHFR
jgi:hypothetical protein